MDRQRDAVRDAYLTQQLSYMRFDGPFNDPQLIRYLAIGAAGNQQSQDFALAIADLGFAARLNPTCRDGRPFNEPGQHPARYPQRAGMNLSNRLLEFFG